MPVSLYKDSDRLFAEQSSRDCDYMFRFGNKIPSLEDIEEFKEVAELAGEELIVYIMGADGNLMKISNYSKAIENLDDIYYSTLDDFKERLNDEIDQGIVDASMLGGFKSIYNSIKNNESDKRNIIKKTKEYVPAWKIFEFLTFGQIFKFYKNLKEESLKERIASIYGFKNHEMELLVRKLPKEAITNHHLIDDRMVKKIVSRINIRENVSVEIVSALFRTIAMTILHIEEIGEKQFDTTLKLVIKGVVEQITKEDR